MEDLKQGSSNSNNLSSESSLQADSGVDGACAMAPVRRRQQQQQQQQHRKFSSDTLDLGPRSGILSGNRKLSGFSDDTTKEEEEEEEEAGWSSSDDAPQRSRSRRLRAARRRTGSEEDDLGASGSSGSSSGFVGSAGGGHQPRSVPVSGEEFSELIRLHHSRVLEQLKLEDGEGEEEGDDEDGQKDKDSGIQDFSSKDQKQRRRSSLARIRALKAAFGSSRGRSAGSLNNNNADAASEETKRSASPQQQQQQQAKVKRFQSFDAKLEKKGLEEEDQAEKSAKGGGGWLRKLKKMSLASSGQESSSSSKRKASKDDSDVPVRSTGASEDYEKHLRRFQRSRVTGRWENLRGDTPL